jgi:hypothetical protein
MPSGCMLTHTYIHAHLPCGPDMRYAHAHRNAVCRLTRFALHAHAYSHRYALPSGCMPTDVYAYAYLPCGPDMRYAHALRNAVCGLTRLALHTHPHSYCYLPTCAMPAY